MLRFFFCKLALWGLLTILVGGLFVVGRRGQSSAYWLAYDTVSVQISRILPNGRYDSFQIESAQRVVLFDWSPDGRWLLYSDESTSGRDLFRVHVSGAPAQQLTAMPGFAQNAAYSPDGEWILFSTGAANNVALYRIPAAGGAAQKLTEDVIEALAGTWSPDGEWIAFSALDADLRRSIYRMRSNGSDLERLYESPNLRDASYHPAPVWSPDGEWIAFSDGRSGIQTQLYRIRADGSMLQPLTDVDSECHRPIYTEDGLYSSCERDGKFDIYRLDLEQTCGDGDLCAVPLLTEPISSGPDDHFAYSVSPDGKWLFTVRIRDTSMPGQFRELAVVSTDGSGSQYIRGYDNAQLGTDIWSPLIDLPFRGGMIVMMGGLSLLASVASFRMTSRNRVG